VAGAASVALFGFAATFAVNALSYAALIAALFVVHPAARAARPERASFLDGLRSLRSDPRRLAFLGIIAAIALAIDPVNTLTPFYVTSVFGRPDTDAGLLIGAFGLGATVGAFVVPHATGGWRRMGLELLLTGAGMAGLAFAGQLAVALACLAGAGFGYLTAQTAATTRLLLVTPDHMRGRMMALWGIARLGVRPIASLVDGTLAEHLGLEAATVLMALPVVVAGIVLIVLARRASGEVAGLARWGARSCSRCRGGAVSAAPRRARTRVRSHAHTQRSQDRGADPGHRRYSDFRRGAHVA
jgi:hypothetical protein